MTLHSTQMSFVFITERGMGAKCKVNCEKCQTYFQLFHVFRRDTKIGNNFTDFPRSATFQLSHCFDISKPQKDDERIKGG